MTRFEYYIEQIKVNVYSRACLETKDNSIPNSEVELFVEAASTLLLLHMPDGST